MHRLIGNPRATVGQHDLRFAEWTTYAQAFANYNQYTKTRATQLASVRRLLAQSLHILGAGKPQRQIIVTGYFNPFNFNSVIYGELGPLCLSRSARTQTCRATLNETVQLLNSAIAGAVSDYRGTAADASVSLVDGNSSIAAAFLGHESPQPYCGSAPPSFDTTYIQAKPTGRLNIFAVPRNGDDCFHPNPTGHATLARLITPLVRPH